MARWQRRAFFTPMNCHLCHRPIEDLYWRALLPLVSDMPEAEKVKLLTDYGINIEFPLFGIKPVWVEVCEECGGQSLFIISLEIL